MKYGSGSKGVNSGSELEVFGDDVLISTSDHIGNCLMTSWKLYEFDETDYVRLVNSHGAKENRNGSSFHLQWRSRKMTQGRGGGPVGWGHVKLHVM